MPDRGAFVVPVHDLDLTGRSVRFPITPAWLRGALEGCEAQPAGSTGQIDVHFTQTGNDVLVQGQIDTALVIPCARCLEPVEYRPHIEVSLLLHPVPAGSTAPRRPGQGGGQAAAHAPGKGTGKPASKSDDETEFDADDVDNDTYNGEEVVLDRFVREAILLESPIFPLCSEACKGIRPASDSAPGLEGGVTDPRLLPLLELVKRRKLKE
ncbi:MAG TPA: DUF177 domain-containing protein [Polyangiaceae bacterium]|jgi:uncharacterized protein|nr:DUF177 domain-containing protein [Polyangiaceae bacterium]